MENWNEIERNSQKIEDFLKRNIFRVVKALFHARFTEADFMLITQKIYYFIFMRNNIFSAIFFYS